MGIRWRQISGWGLIGLGVVVWGCAPHPGPLVEAQAAAATVTAPEQEKYLLGPEDLIEVSVWKEPELTKQMVVRPDGKISYPLLGDLQAAGLTVKQLQAEIQKRLEKYVTDVNVTVILVKAQYYKIYVTGKVNKPGEFPVGQAPTVMQAIAMAGGLTPFASPGNIVVLRKAGGGEEVFYFDYKDVSQGKSLEQDRSLLPGDVVVVP
jgi:polysaccharide export outer membrane protein